MGTLSFILNLVKLIVYKMKFRTEIDIAKSKNPIEHSEKILTIGSCFADNISGYFKNFRFDVKTNPFGVLYNPVSIFNSFQILAEERRFTESDLLYNQGEWHSFSHHSDFSHHDKQVCLNQINYGIEEYSTFLKNCDRVIITYGTSYVYKFIENNNIVSNCHKIPQQKFERLLLSLNELNDYTNKIIELLKNINSKIGIIFTVSPIRHWRDGAVDNQISKAQLILSINDSINKNESCEYFPSYEILMDDLRDYRFYEADLLHPNKIAIEYIWQKFYESILSDNCQNLLIELEKVMKANKHRIRNPNSESTKKFASENLKLISRLNTEYPHLNLENEKLYFENLLK